MKATVPKPADTWVDSDDGFRRAVCPVCGAIVHVTGLQDDTRWRYGDHNHGKTRCAAAGDLLAGP